MWGFQNLHSVRENTKGRVCRRLVVAGRVGMQERGVLFMQSYDWLASNKWHVC